MPEPTVPAPPTAPEADVSRRVECGWRLGLCTGCEKCEGPAALASEPSTCTSACSEGHTYEAGCVQHDPGACIWPDCLTDAQQTELAAQVGAAMGGEATTPMPDQRQVCGCREVAAQARCDTGIDTAQHACDNCEGIDPGSCLMNPQRVAAPGVAACGNATGACSAGEWCCKGPTPAPPATATLTVTVHAPNATNATRWATSIGQLVTAEFSDSMRLTTSITTPAPDADGTNCACSCEGCAHWCAGHPDPGRCLGVQLADITGAVPGQVSRMLTAVEAHQQATPAPSVSRDALREAIAGAVEECRNLTPAALADAVLAVRDGEVDRLRAKVRRLTSDLAETAGLEETAADRYQNALHWKERAEAAEGAIARVHVQCAEWARPIKSGSWDAQIRDDIAASCADMILAALTAPHAPDGQGNGGGGQ